MPNNNISSIPIGKEIKILRTLLNETQSEFAKSLLLNRVTICNLENLEDVEDITNDIAFRLYYLTFNILQSSCKENYVKAQASKIYEAINTLIEKKRKKRLKK